MKILTEWIEQKISDKDINCFNYNEFKEIGKVKEHWKHCEIGVVTLKNLWKDSFESGVDKIFATAKVLNIIKIKYSVTKLKLINLPFV